MNTSILVIGGSGFTGRHVLIALRSKGYQKITVVSRREAADKIEGIEYFSGIDIGKTETLKDHLQNHEIIINLAGYISFLAKDREKLLEINAKSVEKMIGLCERQQQINRFIHVSSTAAFGFCADDICETTEFDWKKHEKLLPYSFSKHLANRPIHESTVPTNILFPSLILGPGDRLNTGRLLEYVRDKRTVWAPPGKNSVVDVRDFANALTLVLERAPVNENYIVTGETVSFTELLRAAADALGHSCKIRVIPASVERLLIAASLLLEKVGIRTPTETLFLGFRNRSHSSDKIRRLGYNPHYSVDDSFFDFLKNNGNPKV